MKYYCGYPTVLVPTGDHVNTMRLHMFARSLDGRSVLEARIMFRPAPDFCGGFFAFSPQVVRTHLRSVWGDNPRAESAREVCEMLPAVDEEGYVGADVRNPNNRRMRMPETAVMLASLVAAVQSVGLASSRTHVNMTGPVGAVGGVSTWTSCEISGGDAVAACEVAFKKLHSVVGEHCLLFPYLYHKGSGGRVYASRPPFWYPDVVKGPGYRNGNTGRLCASFMYGFMDDGGDDEDAEDDFHDQSQMVEEEFYGMNVFNRSSEEVRRRGLDILSEEAYDVLTHIEEKYVEGPLSGSKLMDASCGGGWGNG
jgi:hypothetical protein